MSKIGKKNIIIPDGVIVVVADGKVVTQGPLGKIEVKLLAGVSVLMENNEIKFSIASDKKQIRSNWGTLRALVANAIEGVTKGFSKKLIIEGVGYRLAKEGDNLNLALGFSHPVKFLAPAGISFEVEKNNILTIKGINKELVGEVAAKIRSLKKPEPYKGKGFRYENEIIRRKAGKKAATA